MLSVAAGFLLFAALMHADVLRGQDTWVGPFQTEGPNSPVVVLTMGQSRPLPGLTDTGGDTLENPSRSDTEVTVAGERWVIGHALHAELRAGKTGVFSHWGNQLYLVPPSAHANGPQLVITADYALQPRPWVTTTLLLAVALIGALRFRIALVEGKSQDLVRWLEGIRRVACIGGGALAGTTLIAYAFTIAHGWVAGYALPTVALFDVFPPMRRLAPWEPNAPDALFALAAIGAIVEWLIRWLESPSTTKRRVTIGMRRWGRLSLLFAAIFLTLLFVMSNGGWRGVMNPAEMNYMSIAGLLPNADAGAYFFAAADLSVDGHWNAVASQRPIAAAIRTGIVAVGGTYVATLILQAAILAICAAIAILGVAEILGLWSAMAFAGLLLGLERPYVTTTMTETLGLGVALLSAPFVLAALRSWSYKFALAAFGLITAALLIRMGSVFTVPFLAAWVVFLGMRGGAGRAALAAVVAVGAGLWFVQWAFLRLFGAAQTGVGTDFAYVLCGLATGTNWSHCLSEATKVIGAQSRASIALEMAWRAFLIDPGVAATSLARNAVSYTVDLPSLLFRQYANVVSIPQEWIALGAAGPILAIAARTKTPFYARALCFFMLVFVTTIASAAMIYDADGRRVLIVTNVLLSLGLALGFAYPAAPRPAASASGRLVLWLILVAFLLAFGLPALVKARVLYRIPLPNATADTMRIAPPPVTPTVHVKPSESPADRRELVVRSELLLQIGPAVGFDPDFTQALDYAATNAPGTLRAFRPSPQLFVEPLAKLDASMGQTYLLFDGSDVLQYRQSDVRVELTRESGLLFRINHRKPNLRQGSTP